MAAFLGFAFVDSADWVKFNLDGKVAAENDCELSFYVRGAAWPEEAAKVWGEAVITKPVSVAAIHALRAEHKNAFIAAIAE